MILLDLATGLERTVYSTFRLGETIESLCFSGDGKELLITSQYQCLACETVSGGLQEVAQAGRNERLAAGHYAGDEIEIAVVEHAAEEEPQVQPYCIFYRRGMENGQPAYLPAWYYLMPALQEEQFPYFIYRSGDLGTGGSNSSEGFQQYWVTRGFFLEQLPGLAALLRPRCYALKGGRRIRVEKQFRPLDMLFVRHERPLTNRYGVGDSGISYLYLGGEQPEAILTDNRECLSYHGDLRELDYRGLREAMDTPLQEGPEGAYWDYAIPWHDGSLMGCYEFYRLARLRPSDNQLLEQIEYEPGISVIGCTFRHIDADDETKRIIRENGGML